MKENGLQGIIPAACSIIKPDLKSLNVDKTCEWAEYLLTDGQSNFVCLLGSTGISHLISPEEKRSLIVRCGRSKFRERFIWGTGSNSLTENIELLKLAQNHGMYYGLLMGSSYFHYEESGAYEWFARLLKELPDAKVILYNFEKLSNFKMTLNLVKKLENNFSNVIAIKDSTGNIIGTRELKRLKVFPGSEVKLLKGLQEYNCSGIITALGNIFSRESSKIYIAWKSGKILKEENNRLILLRKCFDQFSLVSAVHTVLSKTNKDFSNLIAPLQLLSPKNRFKIFSELEKLNFNIAA